MSKCCETSPLHQRIATLPACLSSLDLGKEPQAVPFHSPLPQDARLVVREFKLLPHGCQPLTRIDGVFTLSIKNNRFRAGLLLCCSELVKYFPYYRKR